MSSTRLSISGNNETGNNENAESKDEMAEKLCEEAKVLIQLVYYRCQ